MSRNWNISFVIRGHLDIEADTEIEAREKFYEMTDEQVNEGIIETDISDIWEEPNDET